MTAHKLFATSASPLALGLAMLLTTPAAAQDAAQPGVTANPTAEAQPTTVGTDPETNAAAPEAGEEVIVTGIRASLANSARLKKNNSAIVEVVTAEDIGKLPDVSIADSLARLPGVTAQRLEGRDQRLSVRGLGPDFGVTLMNGREQVTVGDNRGVEYDQYPAEFFRQAVVYKSANSKLLPAGVSGTVDLNTLRPLSVKDPIVAVNLRGQMNGLDKLNPEGDRFGYRASGTFVDKFMGDKFGLALGASVMSSPTQNERYNAWGFPNSGAAGGNLLLGGAKPYVQSNILKRTGLVGTAEYQPNSAMHMTLDVLYSKFKEKQYLRGIEFPIAPDWGGGNVVSYSASNGFVTDAIVNNVVGVVRNDYNQRDADTISIGFNSTSNITDRVKLISDVAYSKADRTDFLLENYIGTGYALSGAKDTIRITQNPNGTFNIVPTLDYTNPANFVITDPRGWGYNGTAAVVQAGFLNKPRFKDKLINSRTALQADLDHNIFNTFELGYGNSVRTKDALYSSAFLCPKDGNPDCTVGGGTVKQLPIPTNLVTGVAQLDYLGVPGMVSLDPLGVYNTLYDVAFDNRPDSLARDYTVTEKVVTLYANLGIDTQMGEIPVRGSVGAQVVETTQSSDGFNSRFSGGVVTAAQASDKDKYVHFLPSADLSFEVVPSTFLKLGASETIIRPRMDQERVTNVINGVNLANLAAYNPANPGLNPIITAYGGNARLRPYQSRNIDVSLEKYFRGGGYVALAGYDKKLTDYVDPNQSIAFDFVDFVNALPAPLPTLLAGKTVGVVSGPSNDGDGYIRGVELTTSLPLSNVTPMLDGFGVFGAIAYVKSEVNYASASQPITIPGLSKYVGTAEGYYEKNGFQARLSYRYRSKFLGEVAGLSASPTFRTAKAEGILDAQVGYDFQSGPLQGFSIVAQAKNLTDRPFVTYQNDDTNQVIDYQHYGRDFYLSASYKF